MIPVLTVFLVVLGVGLTLIVISLRGRKASSEAVGAEEPAQGAKRRIRLVPLVIGLILSLVGGIGAGRVLTGDADDYDRWVLAQWPADWLVDDMNSMDMRTRYEATNELDRRYRAGALSEAVERRLVARKIAHMLGDTTSPEAPMPASFVIDVDLVKARRSELLSSKEWSEFVAQASPLRLDVPRSAPSGQEIPMRLDVSLFDHQAPAWVIVYVDSLTIGGKEVELPPAVAVAGNPQWTPPPPQEAPEPSETPQAQGPGGGGTPPPVLRRVVRYPYTVPAELATSLGDGTFPVAGSITVLAFDSEEVPPPLDLMTDEATGVPRRQRASEDLVAVALSAQLTAEQLDQFRSRALGTHTWKINREIRIGSAPASQPSTRPEQAEQEEQQEQAEDGAGGQ